MKYPSVTTYLRTKGCLVLKTRSVRVSRHPTNHSANQALKARLFKALSAYAQSKKPCSAYACHQEKDPMDS